MLFPFFPAFAPRQSMNGPPGIDQFPLPATAWGKGHNENRRLLEALATDHWYLDIQGWARKLFSFFLKNVPEIEMPEI